MPDKKVIIVGGGLAGLVTSIHLAKAGIGSEVVEKNQYPFHRVCGEYVSNEVVPYLRHLGCYPEQLKPSSISRFQLTSVNGAEANLQLDLGGFGISRYVFDQFLQQYATSLGVTVRQHTEVTDIRFDGRQFYLDTTAGPLEADVILGAFGKRSRLDKQLNRSFMTRSSPYVGVKYHIRLASFPHDMICLHNFQDGYCGISRVEGETINLCYLTHRRNIKAKGSLSAMEKEVMFRNPFIHRLFDQAEHLFEKPESINEVSFETKRPIEAHVLMIGDAAGMITPLCGNGMAMAIRSAKLASEHVLRFCTDTNYSRDKMEKGYAQDWRHHFARRLWSGRQIQNLFGGVWSSNLAVGIANHMKPVAEFLIRQTHGKPF
ncbi:MAG: NAD(P)/FAD-dependent oxidoreductase [Cyclobacteriaceae bacterium]|nr:NAD(P)/FAD-dependent oxidoreductase [Cyclobacteriaceae bacterium]